MNKLILTGKGHVHCSLQRPASAKDGELCQCLLLRGRELLPRRLQYSVEGSVPLGVCCSANKQAKALRKPLDKLPW